MSNLIKKDEGVEDAQTDRSTEDEVVEEDMVEEEISKEVVEKDIVLSDYALQVQNGSGIAGEADLVAEILLAEGFEEIDTANADNYDYVETEVRLTESVSQKLYEEIERALNSDYLIASEAGVIDTTSDFDVIVIVGERLQ